MNEIFLAVFWPDGGRYGFGFNFSCPVCGEGFNVTISNPTAIHPSHAGFLKRKPVECKYAGKKLKFIFPVATVEVLP